MLLKKLIFSVTTAVTLSVLTSDALAWGCSRSCSGSGNHGGSFSHSSSSSGGYGSYSHSGSTTATPQRPDGSGTPTPAATPAPATTITAAIRPEATAPTTMAEAMVAAGSMRRRLTDRMAPPTRRGFIVVEFGENMPTRLPNRNGPRRVGLRGDPLTEVEALAFLALWSGSGDAERLPGVGQRSGQGTWQPTAGLGDGRGACPGRPQGWANVLHRLGTPT